jgi:hypothetical protein
MTKAGVLSLLLLSFAGYFVLKSWLGVGRVGSISGRIFSADMAGYVNLILVRATHAKHDGDFALLVFCPSVFSPMRE